MSHQHQPQHVGGALVQLQVSPQTALEWFGVGRCCFQECSANDARQVAVVKESLLAAARAPSGQRRTWEWVGAKAVTGCACGRAPLPPVCVLGCACGRAPLPPVCVLGALPPLATHELATGHKKQKTPLHHRLYCASRTDEAV